MRNVKPILIASLALTAICVAVVAALAVTNLLTEDTIAAQEAAATNAACKEVFGSADVFTLIEGEWQDGVLEVYAAKSGDTLCGYVVKTTTNGKSSGLVVMTGVTADGVVSGVAIISDNETAGYIDTVIKGGLLDRLKGIPADVMAVDGVSQATKSSNGIKKGVDLALKTVEEVTSVG